ncbi:MAG: RES family NAD+ phosphorylase [Legionella sp.]|nr:RES family NAD+ phosphorylase [Legionella sp.]
MTEIWRKTNGASHIKPLIGLIYRLVESQEQVATLGLVNNVYEQGVLEELIETTKNPIPEHTEKLHYLLKTPFRYPPLKYGSRFGQTFERGLFYGSLNIDTALVETAYYRFVYMMGPEIPFHSTISSEYSSFSVKIRAERGVCLDLPPFSEYESILISPCSYSETQQLGACLRDADVEAFRYSSARDKNKGKNIALFTPEAFFNNKPSKLTTWICQTSINEVGFLSKENQKRILFSQNYFWVDNKFPSPAT